MSQEMRKLMTLVESNIEADYDETVAAAYDIMKELIEDHQSRPGELSVRRNFSVAGGYYGNDQVFAVFLQMKGYRPPGTADLMEKEFLAGMASLGLGLLGDPKAIKTNKGTLTFGTVEGSAWSGFGLISRQQMSRVGAVERDYGSDVWGR